MLTAGPWIKLPAPSSINQLYLVAEGDSVITHTKMLATSVDAGIGAHMTIRGGKRPCRYCRIGRPRAVRVLAAGIADEHSWVQWIRGVLRYSWNTVMVVIVGVGNVLAMDAINLDFKTVTRNARVIDCIEVVYVAVSNACMTGARR